VAGDVHQGCGGLAGAGLLAGACWVHACGCIDGVVDSGAPVPVPLNLWWIRSFSEPAQRCVAQPVLTNCVGQYDRASAAGSGEQVPQELPPLGIAEVESNRPLALIQTCPLEAGAGQCQWPPAQVRATAHRIDSYHFGSELG